MIRRDLLSTRRLLAAAAALALAAGVVAGCGDDDDDDGGAAATQTTEFTGEPVIVYLMAPLKTEIADVTDALAAAKAAAKTINDQGGLNGSELRIESCNDTDANAELACVRKAQADGAAAFIGSSFIFNPKAGQAALLKAKIPSISPLAIQQVEFGTPINFPVYTTSFGLLACAKQVVDATGAERVSATAQDLPVQKELLETIEAIAHATNVPFGKNVTVPQSQTDFSSTVKELSDSGADAVVSILTAPSQPAFFTAARSVGADFKAICSAPSNHTYETLRQLGADADKVYISSGLPATDEESAEKLPLVKQFREEMEAAEEAGDDDADLGNLKGPGNAFNAWLGVQILKQVAADVDGQLTGPALFAALNKATVDLTGAGMPMIDFSRPAPAPGLERLFYPIVRLSKWNSSKQDLEAVDTEPVNLLELFAAVQQK